MLSPGCDLSHVPFANPFHADAKSARLPLIATSAFPKTISALWTSLQRVDRR
jgi:hypothetical protein